MALVAQRARVEIRATCQIKSQHRVPNCEMRISEYQLNNATRS